MLRVRRSCHRRLACLSVTNPMTENRGRLSVASRMVIVPLSQYDAVNERCLTKGAAGVARNRGNSDAAPRDRLWARPERCRSKRRSEEHTSELQSLMRISYAVFCLKKKNKAHTTQKYNKVQKRKA